MYSTKPTGYNLMTFALPFFFWNHLLKGGLFFKENKIGIVHTAFQKISKKHRWPVRTFD